VIGAGALHMAKLIMMIRERSIAHRVMPLLKEMAKTFLKTMSINIVGIVSVTRPKLPLSSTPLNWADENGMYSESWLRE
jgi:hypothetical protein